VLNYKIRSRQIVTEHNFMKYPCSYMFRPYRVIIRLTFRTYEKKYMYGSVKTGFDISVILYPLLFQRFLWEEKFVVRTRGQQNRNLNLPLLFQRSKRITGLN